MAPHPLSEREARETARADLIEAVEALGFPAEFGQVIADELGGEKSMRRMTAYLWAARPRSADEIADEMLAILQQRQAWVQKKVSERANASVTEFYNRERDECDE